MRIMRLYAYPTTWSMYYHRQIPITQLENAGQRFVLQIILLMVGRQYYVLKNKGLSQILNQLTDLKSHNSTYFFNKAPPLTLGQK
jgi:hypothetical protein